MTCNARALIARLAVIAGATALVLFAAPASAAPPCAERVIDDWSDNGRIDRLYPLPCYESAIDAIPVDLRDYTNAADVIERALTAAARQQPPTGGSGTDSALSSEAAPAVDASGAGSIPVPLIVLVGVSLLVIAAGVVSHVSRRRRDLPGETAAD